MSQKAGGLYLLELVRVLKENIGLIYPRESAIWSDIGWSLPLDRYKYADYDGFSFEMSCVLEGSLKVTVADKTYTYSAGDVFFNDVSIANSCEDGKYTIWSINFSVVDLAENKEVYKQLKEVFSHLIGQSFNVNTQYFKKYFTEIVNEYLSKPFEYILNMKMVLMNILIKVARLYNGPDKRINRFRHSKYSGMVSEIIVFLSENIDREINLAGLGARYSLNARYLNRIFKAVTGYPIYHYYYMLKIEKAKKLLRNSVLNMVEIACELNFASSQHFSKTFKKFTGFTPSEYRRKIRIL